MSNPLSRSSDSSTLYKKKLVFFSNEFPNDDLRDLFQRLHRHAKDRRFRTLSTFIEECTVTLKEEATKLPRQLQDLIPNFETVLSLADHADFRKGALGAAMESAFLCVLQIGMIIGHFEGQDLAYDLIDCQGTLAGLSIGLMAGAAASLSTTLEDLTRTGAEAVRVAFRLGVYVNEVSRKLESQNPDGGLQSWAYVVTEKTQEEVQKEIDEYNTSTGNPDLTKVFISAADKASVSVSGPPSRIKDAFQRSQSLRYSKSLPLPVYDGLCHASHLYSQQDIAFVVNGSPSKVSASRRVQLPLLSSQTGRHFSAETAGDLFLEIATELLTGTIYLDNVTHGILSSIENSEAPDCEIGIFRTTLISQGIIAGIQEDFPNLKVSREDLIEWVYKDFGPRIPRSPRESKLAVVGMACRIPGGANDTELYWQLMEQGRDVHTTVPEDRFDLSTHYDPTGKTENATQVPYGNFIDRPGFFDSGFFNMSPREAEQTDPMHRLALVTAYEALEMAGYVPNRTPSTNLKRIGTYYGQASDDWRELNASQNIGTYAVPGGERAFANGRVNYFFKFGGPSFNIDTACSSGLAAVNAACSSLWSGDADTVIAGGLNIITDPDNYAGLGNGHFLSKTGQCKVWDKDADGYCRADGVGSVVLKRLEDAEADNDNILAVILAAATNHSAEAISITYPHAGAQKENYAQVMHRAGINPLDVSYIELHGTGTQAGDAVESESVSDIFAPLSPRRRPDQRLHLGAVKCNIGHGEAAAGIASLIKMLLIYQKNEIPPHIGIKTELNPTLPQDLEKRNVGLALSKTPWPKTPGKTRHAVVNSFGAHGGNTTVLLEDAPERQRTGVDQRSTHIVAVSAKSRDSLKANMQNLLAYLDEHPDTDLGDLSYTTTNRRMQHSLRTATAVSSLGQLRKFLQSSLDGGAEVRPVPLEPPSVVFAFTGQGAFYRGIGRELFEDFPYFHSQVLQLDHIVKRLGFQSVLPVIDGSIDEGSCSPVVSQLSVVVVEIALSQFWTVLGIQPDAVIGHSLGEYAALVAAGVISASDCLFLVGKRAEHLSTSCEEGSHGMLSVRAGADEIRKIVGDVAEYEVSCFNGPEDTVVGGAREHIDRIRQALEAAAVKCVRLSLPCAFHTSQVEPVLESFERLASHISFKAPNVPVISPLLGSCIFDDKTINANYLRRASREPVRFVDAVVAARDLGVVSEKTVWIDIGPHPICGGFVRSLIPEAGVVSSFRRNEDNIATIAKSLAALHITGIPICWQEYFRPHERAHRLLPLKKYSWNEKNYWIPYVGTWTLDKAHVKTRSILGGPSISAPSPLKTSLVHQVTMEEVRGTTGKLQIISDMMHADFLTALQGHMMNNNGVATSSIWSDMSFTVGEYLYKRVDPEAKEVHINLADFEVLHAQVARKPKANNTQQLLALEASLDLTTKSMSLAWYTVSSSTRKRAAEHFASGTVFFEDASQWRREWERVAHLVLSRISTLESMAATGAANRLSRNMAYELFRNVVDYAEEYRGMTSVVLHEYEAVADVTLSRNVHGTWHTPPFWIDAATHIGGLVMNGSDASNTRDFFYVTPGCESFRLARPLEGGAHYRSYVRMAPTAETGMYAGDVYILQDGVIVGMVRQLKFRRVPRIMMDHFFSAPKDNEGGDAYVRATPPRAALAVADAPAAPAPAPAPAQTAPASAAITPPESSKHAPGPLAKVPEPAPKRTGANIATSESSAVEDCLDLIATETGLERSDFRDESTFVELGVDSLMSLVLAEKFRHELSIEIKSSLFLECPTIGELKAWLEQYC